MIEAAVYGAQNELEWDAFCAGAVNATLLHTRRFLSYHRDRIRDRSLLLREDDKLVALLPAGEAGDDPDVVVSHPGATYGGLIHQGRLRGARMLEAMQVCAATMRQFGYQRFRYKPVPHVYQQIPSQDDLYALFRVGARRIRCDLASVVDIENRGPVSERRKRGLKKAARVVELSSSETHLSALWVVLEENLLRKHGARPVHTLAEIAELQERFPQDIMLRAALIDGTVEAGVVFFRTPMLWHAQYIAASENANDACALDAVFHDAIREAGEAGARFFDFGTSNEQAGLVLNDGLYRFKSEFGGGGVVYEQYELTL